MIERAELSVAPGAGAAGVPSRPLAGWRRALDVATSAPWPRGS